MAWRRVSPLALVAGVLLVAVAVLYASILHGEGQGDLAGTGPRLVLAVLGTCAAAAFAGGVASDARVRIALLGPAAALVLGLAAVAVFSIGAPLAVPGLLLLVAAVRASDGVDGRVAALTAPLTVGGAFVVFWAAALLLTTAR